MAAFDVTELPIDVDAKCRCLIEKPCSRKVQMVVSQNKGAQYRPQNIIVLIMGTPKIVPLILGNPQISTKRSRPKHIRAATLGSAPLSIWMIFIM